MRQLQLSLLFSLPQPLKPLSLYTFSLRTSNFLEVQLWIQFILSTPPVPPPPNRLILLCLSILVSLQASNFVFYLFIYPFEFFFTEVFSLAQCNPKENHYANIFNLVAVNVSQSG